MHHLRLRDWGWHLRLDWHRHRNSLHLLLGLHWGTVGTSPVLVVVAGSIRVVPLSPIVSVAIAIVLLTLRATLAVLMRTPRRCSTSLPLMLLLHHLKLLSLAVLRDLREKLQEGQEELTLLRSQIVAQLLQLLHVLLYLFSLLVASELNLVNAFKHVGLPLLSRFKLADEQRAAAERPF